MKYEPLLAVQKSCRERGASERGRLHESFEREIDSWPGASAGNDVRADDGSKVIAITDVRRHLTPYECAYVVHPNAVRLGLDLRLRGLERCS